VSTGLNFAWWGLAVVPTYFLVRQIGVNLNGADVKAVEEKQVEEEK